MRPRERERASERARGVCNTISDYMLGDKSGRRLNEGVALLPIYNTPSNGEERQQGGGSQMGKMQKTRNIQSGW